MKINLAIILAAAFLLFACEQQEQTSSERTELPAADITDRDDQRTDLHTEDQSGDDSSSNVDIHELQSNEEAIEDAHKRSEEMAEEEAYTHELESSEEAIEDAHKRSEEMAEEISDKIEQRLD